MSYYSEFATRTQINGQKGYDKDDDNNNHDDEHDSKQGKLARNPFNLAWWAQI